MKSMQPSKQVGYKIPRQKEQQMQRLWGRKGPDVLEEQEAGVAKV